MKNIKNAQVNWLAGMLGTLVVIAASVAVNQVSMKIGILLGSMVIFAIPFVLWLSIIVEKQKIISPSNDHSRFYNRNRQRFEE